MSQKTNKGHKKPHKVWLPNGTCSCVLTYTDITKLGTIPADNRLNRPLQAYDADGHYMCQACEKDWNFSGQAQPKHPKTLHGQVEKNGHAWHCACGVDVCMACAVRDALPGRKYQKLVISTGKKSSSMSSKKK